MSVGWSCPDCVDIFPALSQHSPAWLGFLAACSCSHTPHKDLCSGNTKKNDQSESGGNSQLFCKYSLHLTNLSNTLMYINC